MALRGQLYHGWAVGNSSMRESPCSLPTAFRISQTLKFTLLAAPPSRATAEHQGLQGPRIAVGGQETRHTLIYELECLLLHILITLVRRCRWRNALGSHPKSKPAAVMYCRLQATEIGHLYCILQSTVGSCYNRLCYTDHDLPLCMRQ